MNNILYLTDFYNVDGELSFDFCSSERFYMFEKFKRDYYKAIEILRYD